MLLYGLPGVIVSEPIMFGYCPPRHDCPPEIGNTANIKLKRKGKQSCYGSSLSTPSMPMGATGLLAALDPLVRGRYRGKAGLRLVCLQIEHDSTISDLQTGYPKKSPHFSF